MHAGKLRTSPRLRSLFDALVAAGERGATTRELINITGNCAISADVSELRAKPNGVKVTCEYEMQSRSGRRVYRYWLTALRRRA